MPQLAQDTRTAFDIPLNRKDRRCVTSTGVWPQNIEEVRKARHGNGVVGLFAAIGCPVIGPRTSVAAANIGVPLREGKPRGQDLIS